MGQECESVLTGGGRGGGDRVGDIGAGGADHMAERRPMMSGEKWPFEEELSGLSVSSYC